MEAVRFGISPILITMKICGFVPLFIDESSLKLRIVSSIYIIFALLFWTFNFHFRIRAIEIFIENGRSVIATAGMILRITLPFAMMIVLCVQCLFNRQLFLKVITAIAQFDNLVSMIKFK